MTYFRAGGVTHWIPGFSFHARYLSVGNGQVLSSPYLQGTSISVALSAHAGPAHSTQFRDASMSPHDSIDFFRMPDIPRTHSHKEVIVGAATIHS